MYQHNAIQDLTALNFDQSAINHLQIHQSAVALYSGKFKHQLT